MRTFINLTAHKLTAEQVQAAKELGATEFFEATDILPPDTLEKLRNCPSDYKELTAIVYEIIGALKQMPHEDKSPFVHLPCGSPALMWLLCAIHSKIAEFGRDFLIPVFSHSERDSQETVQADGSIVKNSVFRFQKFIVI